MGKWDLSICLAGGGVLAGSRTVRGGCESKRNQAGKLAERQQPERGSHRVGVDVDEAVTLRKDGGERQMCKDIHPTGLLTAARGTTLNSVV